MAYKINIGLIQNKYTDFIVYDESNRQLDEDWIALKDINSLKLYFKDTSPELEHNRIYWITNDKKGYVISYKEFSVPKTYSGYLESKYLVIEVDGTELRIEIDIDIATVSEMVDFLNTAFTGLNIIVYNTGNFINARTTTTGENVYIKLIEGTLLDDLGWNKGIYRGNNINWNSLTLRQKDFYFLITAEDFGYFSDTDDETTINEIPETYWDVTIITSYSPSETILTYTDEYTEFTYKQTEIYLAKIFEYISRNFMEFMELEGQRYQTQFEIFMQKSIYFDAIYKSFLASLLIGNKIKSYELLKKLISYKELNPIQ